MNESRKLTVRQIQRVAAITSNGNHLNCGSPRRSRFKYPIGPILRAKLRRRGWITVSAMRLTARGLKGFRRIAGELGDSVKWSSGKLPAGAPRSYHATVGKHFYRIEPACNGWYCYITLNARWELVRATRTLWQAKVFPFLYEAGDVGFIEEK